MRIEKNGEALYHYILLINGLYLKGINRSPNKIVHRGKWHKVKLCFLFDKKEKSHNELNILKASQIQFDLSVKFL